MTIEVEAAATTCVNFIDNGGVPPPPPPAVPAGMAVGGPCFTIAVVVNGTASGGEAFALRVTMTEDRYTTVEHLSSGGRRLCL